MYRMGLWTLGGGKGGINGESSTGVYTLPCANRAGGKAAALHRERAGWEGASFRREAVCVSVELIRFTVQQRLTQHCKATIPPPPKKKKLPGGLYKVANHSGVRAPHLQV